MLGLTLWELLNISGGRLFPQAATHANFARFLAEQMSPAFARGGSESQVASPPRAHGNRKVPLAWTKSTPRVFRNLIEWCCAYEAEDRPSISEVVLRLETLQRGIKNGQHIGGEALLSNKY